MVFLNPRSEPSCSYCNGEIDTATGPFCKECGVSIHSDCWESFGGCATSFCIASPGFDGALVSKDSKANYLGAFPSATRFCPQCGDERIGIFCGNCGIDFVTLETRQIAQDGGRTSDELLSEEVDALRERPEILIRGRKFDPKTHCENCGLKMGTEVECSRCLHER